MDARYLEALISRGNLLSIEKRWEEARSDFEGVLQIVPDSAAAYLGVAECETQMNNPDGAIEAYERAIQADRNVSSSG
ncbi:MAG: tetratricopeptide repeat protein [Candidatus Pacebacteria bacterium]|nr:tetratricopeptide repeat protein [Candidatus Paceibacterota bacterium]